MDKGLDQYGLTEHWSALFGAVANELSRLGRVVRQDRGFVMVATADEFVLAAVRLGRNSPVVVGDWVVVEHEAVTTVLERQSLLSRRDAHAESEQAIVANVDLVLIVCGADRPLNARRIERAVTQTVEAKATPVIVITKIDLLEDRESLIDLKSQVPTVEVIGLSSHGDVGLDEVRALMNDRTSVMIGESGAGKSTLLNALAGADVVQTGAVRVRDAKGRHTTVRRELHLLPDGGSLIDTPGVRALGLWADEESVAATFPDIAELAQQCRFADCAHNNEPGCAINAAVAAGTLERARAEAFKGLTEEAGASVARKQDQKRRGSGNNARRVVDNDPRHKSRKNNE